MWSLANRFTDWFFDELTKDLDNYDLEAFIAESARYQGFDFPSGVERQKTLTIGFLQLLQKRLPKMIADAGDEALANHLKNLLRLVSNQII